jgi:hypothetical protein
LKFLNPKLFIYALLPIFCSFPLFLRTFILFSVIAPKRGISILPAIFVCVLYFARTDEVALSPCAFLSIELLTTEYQGGMRYLVGSLKAQILGDLWSESL